MTPPPTTLPVTPPASRLDTLPVRVRAGWVAPGLRMAMVAWLAAGIAGMVWADAWRPAVAAAFGSTTVSTGLAIGAVAAWLLAGVALWQLLAGHAHRYAFGREALQVRSWRGRWRAHPWADAEAARLVHGRRGIELVVTFRPRTRRRIPLMAYHGSARLLVDLENRLPVSVSAPPRWRARLEAADAA